MSNSFDPFEDIIRFQRDAHEKGPHNALRNVNSTKLIFHLPELAMIKIQVTHITRRWGLPSIKPSFYFNS